MGIVPGVQFDLLSGGRYYVFCVGAGAVWCFLFAYVYLHTCRQHRRRLWWLLPLAFFAFAIPANLVALWLALARGGAHGEMP
jgi:hypothetical protein